MQQPRQIPGLAFGTDNISAEVNILQSEYFPQPKFINMLEIKRGVFLGHRNTKNDLLKKLKVRRQQMRINVTNKWRIYKQQDFKNFDIFHCAIKPYILFAQIFGLMPLKNTLSTSPNRLKFSIHSIAMIFTAHFVIFGGLKTLHFTAEMLAAGLNAKNIVGIVFFYITFVICINFWYLAKNWPGLIRYWTQVDLIFLLPPYEPVKWTIRKKLKVIAFIFVVIASAEHVMYHWSEYYSFRMLRTHCEPGLSNTLRDYVEGKYTDIFTYVPYNGLFAFYAVFLNGMFTVIWNFPDFFIILISLGLSTRFQQFATRIQTLTGRFVPDSLWCELRQHHIKLCELMEYVDEQLSNIVLISALNNMYFICNKLLNIFSKQRWPINYIYFWFSLIFLLTRSAGVFLFAAKIHDASLLPLKTLYLVPRSCWSVEVQRFTSQITDECIALSGKRFFFVTRKSLFGLVATIVTYEFMLLQFDANNRKLGLPDLCGFVKSNLTQKV